ncbi:hypothetical protein ACFU6I_08240 [Streptomyces sp. NPDC057486]|uniref:hypothetical protein n=1 Tax=Streptomyces sp. NPDC057486 TaxID=3346145 RepID=UPI0036C4912B
MNHPSDTPTGPAALALPLILATEFAAVARRSPEVRATTRATGRRRRAARRRATAVRG